jgi:hypothetical protein
MRKLMIVKATSQLSLFKVRGYVFIWHFLETSLEKIDFLESDISWIFEKESQVLSYLIFVPSSASPRR